MATVQLAKFPHLRLSVHQCECRVGFMPIILPLPILTLCFLLYRGDREKMASLASRETWASKETG